MERTFQPAQRAGRQGSPVRAWLVGAVAALLAVGPWFNFGLAAAAAGTVTEFPLPGSFFFPGSITTGPDGALWFTETDRLGA
jgi:hypothetical protein